MTEEGGRLFKQVSVRDRGKGVCYKGSIPYSLSRIHVPLSTLMTYGGIGNTSNPFGVRTASFYVKAEFSIKT